MKKKIRFILPHKTSEELLDLLGVMREREKGDKGDKGDAYVLTNSDKKEIADSIPVPIVEKVIEKTVVREIPGETIIREIPIVTNEIKEVATLDEATIGYLEDKINSVEKKVDEIPGHKETNFGHVIRDIYAGTGVTIDKTTDPHRPTINVTAPGGSVTKGIAEVDFGAITQNNDIATVTVADTAITATSYPSVSLYALATTDHDSDDYMAEGLIPYVSSVTAGVGFDISVRAPDMSWGKYKVTYMY